MIRVPRWAIGVFLVAIAPRPAAADLPGLIGSLPAGYDAAALIDGKALRSGPDGKALAAAFQVPATADLVVFAARIDPQMPADDRRVILVELADDRTPEALAHQVGGAIESIGGRPSIHLPDGPLVARLAPKVYGGIYPARRRAFALWMKDAGPPHGPATGYLKEAVAGVGAGTPVVLAQDLEDAVGPSTARAAIRSSAALADKAGAIDELVSLLTSLRGLRLAIAPGSPPRGELRVDFARPVAPLGEAAKPFLLEVLDRLGASVADFDDWTASVQGQAITLAGPLSPEGLGQVAGLFVLPTAPIEAGAPAAGPTPARVAAASKRYYDEARAVQDELKKMRGALRGRTVASQAIWYNKFADKMDQIPVLDVDPDLVKFGDEVAKHYRGMAFALNGVNLATNARRGDFDQTRGNYEQVRRQETTYAQGNLMQLQAEVDTLTAEIRKAMTQKYRIEF